MVNILSAEAVKSLALTLEGVDNIQSGDGLALGVLSVGDGITDDVLEECFENHAGLLIHHTGDTLNTATASQTADRGLRNAVDVVA